MKTSFGHIETDDDDYEEHCLMVVVAKSIASESPPMRDHCIINIDWFAYCVVLEYDVIKGYKSVLLEQILHVTLHNEPL